MKLEKKLRLEEIADVINAFVNSPKEYDEEGNEVVGDTVYLKDGNCVYYQKLSDNSITIYDSNKETNIIVSEPSKSFMVGVEECVSRDIEINYHIDYNVSIRISAEVTSPKSEPFKVTTADLMDGINLSWIRYHVCHFGIIAKINPYFDYLKFKENNKKYTFLEDGSIYCEVSPNKTAHIMLDDEENINVLVLDNDTVADFDSLFAIAFACQDKSEAQEKLEKLNCYIESGKSTKKMQALFSSTITALDRCVSTYNNVDKFIEEEGHDIGRAARIRHKVMNAIERGFLTTSEEFEAVASRLKNGPKSKVYKRGSKEDKIST